MQLNEEEEKIPSFAFFEILITIMNHVLLVCRRCPKWFILITVIGILNYLLCQQYVIRSVNKKICSPQNKNHKLCEIFSVDFGTEMNSKLYYTQMSFNTIDTLMVCGQIVMKYKSIL